MVQKSSKATFLFIAWTNSVWAFLDWNGPKIKFWPILEHLFVHEISVDFTKIHYFWNRDSPELLSPKVRTTTILLYDNEHEVLAAFYISDYPTNIDITNKILDFATKKNVCSYFCCSFFQFYSQRRPKVRKPGHWFSLPALNCFSKIWTFLKIVDFLHNFGLLSKFWTFFQIFDSDS